MYLTLKYRTNTDSLIVTLTAEGRAVLARKDNEFNDRLDRLIASIGESDVKQMLEILNRMKATVDQFDSEP